MYKLLVKLDIMFENVDIHMLDTKRNKVYQYI